MSENESANDDRTEDATPERREEFRDRGQVANSRELTSVGVLAGCVVLITYNLPLFLQSIRQLFISNFQQAAFFRPTTETILPYLFTIWLKILIFIIPLFAVAAIVGTMGTLFQTRFNFSWEKISPDFSKMNLFSGVMRMISRDALVELLKSIAKTVVVGYVAYMILRTEWHKVPSLMLTPLPKTWAYWAIITKQLIWSTSSLLMFLAGVDFFYTWFSLEQKMKMTKQEVKEEYKRRETDPMIKARMRRMQRDIVMRKTLDKTKQATVIITNPTHYAVAIKYELGMSAPVVLAKGIDFLALRMREVGKTKDIPIVENPPLARTLFKLVKEGQEIPDSLFKAVSEVIRYVFQLKGIKITRNQQNKAEASSSSQN